MSAMATDDPRGRSPLPGPEIGSELGAVGEVLMPLLGAWKTIVLGSLAAGVMALAATYLLTPRFTSRVAFFPAPQQQGLMAAALNQLGPLGGLAGESLGQKKTGDQLVALLRSVTIADRIIDRFRLLEAYEVDLRMEAREELEKRYAVSLGRKDGLISVQVEDESPQRAAEMANQFVEELRQLTGTLALTEAQLRRKLFEAELKLTSERLAKAQAALQAIGFNAGALKAQPKAAADGYARLHAEATSAEVRLQALRRALTDGAPEVQQQQSTLDALRSKLAQAEKASAGDGGAPDYIGRYRDFKYQESLFELYAKQFELARLEEGREGPMIQIVDRAQPAERKSWPRRGITAVAATLIAALALCAYFAIRWRSRRLRGQPAA